MHYARIERVSFADFAFNRAWSPSSRLKRIVFFSSRKQRFRSSAVNATVVFSAIFRLDPHDKGSVFYVKIRIENSEPVIEPVPDLRKKPNLNRERVYTIEAKKIVRWGMA